MLTPLGVFILVSTQQVLQLSLAGLRSKSKIHLF